MITLRALFSRVRTFFDSPIGRQLRRWGRISFVGGILAYLVVRLSTIGWSAFVSSLPTSPIFYLTIGCLYSLLPLSESLIYRRLWNAPAGKILPVVLGKRALNADVVGYTGEVMLYVQSRQHVAAGARMIRQSIKDNLIVSSLSSLSTAFIVLTVLLATGQILLPNWSQNSFWAVLSVGILAGVLGLAVYGFRHAIFSLPRRDLMFMSAVHLTRFLAGFVIQVVQWWSVVPDAPFSSWATLLSAMIVTNRIPFLPSRDILFAGAGIELSAVVGVPAAVMAGMLLVRTGIDKILNAGFFLFAQSARARGANDRPARRYGTDK